jgi:2'-5' RNA ligase
VEDFFAAVADRWPPGREDYHWHVLPGTELARQRLARPYAELTSQPGLAPVRPEYMHVTVQHIGPVDDIAPDELAQITGRVRAGCSSVASFAVTAGRAEAWETSIVCPLRPGYLLGNLWHLVTSVSRAVTGPRLAINPAVYHPHLALAYVTAHLDQSPLRAWLADCDAADAALPVTGLALVAQQHDGREITFRVVDEIPLTGGQRQPR